MKLYGRDKGIFAIEVSDFLFSFVVTNKTQESCGDLCSLPDFLFGVRVFLECHLVFLLSKYGTFVII